MARIFSDGFELGALNFDFSVAMYATIPYPAGTARSGEYVLHGESHGYADLNVEGEDELYIRFGAKMRADVTNPEVFFQFRNSLGQPILSLTCGANKKMGVMIQSTNVDLSDQEQIPLKGWIWHLVEVHYKKTETEILLETRIEGVTDIAKTIDISGLSGLDLAWLRWLPPSSRVFYYDDIAVNTADAGADGSWPGDGKILALWPNGNGTQNDFTGSDGDSTNNYQLINTPWVATDTTYVESATAGATDLYAIADPSFRQNDIIKRVWVAAVAKDAAAESDEMSLGVKLGANSVWTPSGPLTENYRTYVSAAQTQKPGGGSWDETALTDLEVGVKVS
ncbi:MAG: hypothetical protein IT320_18655 [Anaerolineae bacterium]|nr:hypothetical protein [Anaerolineae bacterium]